ncbi:MAG: cytochrome C [Pseudomonas sp.]|jgi:sulfide dehydrogenase [flavocytochrome c] flavoprotein subunit|uniref:NAD(P)/FAD-dependent oxidoreductase n=1 Tax=Pseudomonas sp. FEMGT703P TaxID=2080764 RepID=UPI000CA78E32|nr:NAD(P)/FAD-dependent oxidoreductase [Pseudomonas sp. FEMGT703P]PJE40552.1 MAG: cytochrome C [Pseudomonas sp.] [Pseudomonas sp. FEMGT703P]
MQGLTRRQLLAGAAMLPWLLPGALQASVGRARVLVIGGGFAGATAARYLKRQAEQLDVVLIEPKSDFHTCPFSNHVLAGLRELGSLRQDYRALQQQQVLHVREWAREIDLQARQVVLQGGQRLRYDRVLLAPGIDMDWQAIEGYDRNAASRLPHAWQAGAQTALLRRQLQAMDDGGLVIISVPDNPYRCPPGPYERASLIAHYLSQAKPRSKVLILDSKDSFSKQALFQQGWQALYGERIEWVGRAGDGRVVRADAGRRELLCEFGQRHRAAVINLIPPQKAAEIAARSGLVDSSGWVPIRPVTFQAREAGDIYVAGDACIAAPMPKSAYSANAQAKVAVAALLADLAGQEPPSAAWRNTCYSALAPGQAVSIAADYGIREQRLVELPGSLTLSPLQPPAGLRAQEAALADAWYQSICMDAWGHLA